MIIRRQLLADGDEFVLQRDRPVQHIGVPRSTRISQQSAQQRRSVANARYILSVAAPRFTPDLTICNFFCLWGHIESIVLSCMYIPTLPEDLDESASRARAVNLILYSRQIYVEYRPASRVSCVCKGNDVWDTVSSVQIVREFVKLRVLTRCNEIISRWIWLFEIGWIVFFFGTPCVLLCASVRYAYPRRRRCHNLTVIIVVVVLTAIEIMYNPQHINIHMVYEWNNWKWKKKSILYDLLCGRPHNVVLCTVNVLYTFQGGYCNNNCIIIVFES